MREDINGSVLPIDRRAGAVPPFRTRHKHIHVGLDETSLFHTVLNGGTTPPLLRHYGVKGPAFHVSSKYKGMT